MDKSELDQIRSSITISLGTKNKLRSLKGTLSYEEYINQLLKLRNQITNQPSNYIEIQNLERRKALYNFESFKITFTYNEFVQSENYTFDITIEKIRDAGKIITFEKYLEDVAKIMEKSREEIKTKTYFQLLQVVIRKEIDSLFKHKGRPEDYYLWEKEFERLNLPHKAFEEDVMYKLHSYGK